MGDTHLSGLDLDAGTLKIGGVVLAGTAANLRKRIAHSAEFDLDNGAGTTVDEAVFIPSVAITITSAKILYSEATTGTVAAGNVKAGTTVGGAEIFAATAYENTKAVGATTAITLAAGAVAANTPVLVRHTGVAAAQAGKARVVFEFTID